MPPENLQLRPITPAEVERYIRVTETYFAADANDDFVKMTLEFAEPERSYAVFDGQAMVAVGANSTLEVSVPGGSTVPLGGVVNVAVSPTHRRQGLGARLMRHLLEDSREHGETLSMLTASEGTIYERFGYGPAMTMHKYQLPADRVEFAAGADEISTLAQTAEFVDADQAKERFARVQAAAAARRPGMVLRDQAWWRARLDHDFGSNMSNRRLVMIGDRAYATYRVDDDWGNHGPEGKLVAQELVATDPVAAAAMWQFLASHDLITNLEAWMLPQDDPFPYQLRDTQAVMQTMDDPYFLRLVDVPGALAARGYPASAELVLEVHDAFLPGNQGRWLLSAGPEHAACTGTDQPADITLDVSVLGSLYLGGVSATRLADAGRITAHSSDAVARAQSLFTTERAPRNTTPF